MGEKLMFCRDEGDEVGGCALIQGLSDHVGQVVDV